MNHNTIPQKIYSLHLATINGIKFSKREIDIIACILSGRSAKGIAHFLSIAPKTAEVHIYNVMKKLDCNSRDNVITFIQNSDKFLIVKQYYLSLLTYLAFEESLKKIAQLIGDKHPTCFIVSNQEQGQSFLLQQLKSNLDLIGLKTIVEVRKKNEPIFNLIQKNKTEGCIIFFMPKLLDEEEHNNISKLIQRGPKALCLIFENEEEQEKNTFKESSDVKCMTLTDYYSSIFEILQKFFPEINIQEVVKKFEQQDTFTQESPQPNLTQKEHVLGVEKSFEFLKIPLLKYRKWGVLISSALILGGLSLGVLNYKAKPIKSVARSDFILPGESVLLNRPELLSKIEENLTEKPGIQTVALVGMGGVGKTTLARQFARQQNVSVVWEINAETDQSLQSSFEDLAFSLAQKPEDKKVLKEIQETKDAKERETKLLSFVKEHLRPLSNWLLIYDNVEKFSDIQKYFPHDPNTWGAGKVLITTRDNNIQNDSHVSYAIQIGELDSNQKLALFNKIIGNRNPENLTKAKKEEVQQFLEKIPPFPLDISVAAYYISSTNTPYEKYVVYLNQDNENFIKINEKIQNETGNYSKTRYNIISTSLKSLLSMNKNFTDLLLLISLIDSQNIPRDLLNNYKDGSIVDNFIYNLKKFSLISDRTLPFSSQPVISIHRSTQKIILTYLKNELKLSKGDKIIDKIVSLVERYSDSIINAEDSANLKFIREHIASLLKNNSLLNISQVGSLNSNLGSIHYHLGNFAKAEILFKEGISNLNRGKKNNIRLALALEGLGKLYSELGNYKNAAELREKSLLIFNKYSNVYYFEILRISSNLGYVYKEMGEYKKAKELFEQNIASYSRNPPKTYVDFAWLLLYSGYIHQDLNNHEKAKEQYEKCIAVCQEHLPKNHVINAWVLSSLGNIYREFGNLEKAKSLIAQALSICKIHLSDNHVGYAFIINHLGRVYREKGDYKKARALLEKSLFIYKVHYKKDHVRIALTLEELAKLDLLESRRAEGVALFKEALKLMEENKHPNIYMILEDLAAVYFSDSETAFKKGQKKQSQELRKIAISYLRQTHESLLKHFPKNSPHIIRIENKIKNLEEKLRSTSLPPMSYLKQTSYYAY